MLEPVTDSQLDTSSSSRLVIRVKLVSPEPPPPARRRLSRSAWVLILGAVAVPLCWLGFSTFRPHPSTGSVAPLATHTEDSSVVVHQPPPTPVAETTVTNEAEAVARSAEAEVRQQPEPPPLTLHEEIPAVPRSALETIRGTVKVSVRVIVDSQGTVVAATADDRGPSRYFERLSVEAAKNWTFTPVKSDEQQIMLVRFNFTRAGATAHASPLQ